MPHHEWKLDDPDSCENCLMLIWDAPYMDGYCYATCQAGYFNDITMDEKYTRPAKCKKEKGR